MIQKFGEITLLFIVLTCPQLSFAQDKIMHLHCIDTESGKAIPHFPIQINSTRYIGNDSGIVTFVAIPESIMVASVSELYELTVERLVIPSGQKDISVFCIPKNKSLEQVVVSAGRYEQNIKRVAVSTEIIKPQLIENKVTGNMEKFMDQIPGVHITDGQANIRNGSGWSYGAGSRVMILVDDLPFLGGDAGQAPWKFIPQEALEHVEVIKGASSVLYGSSALNGIIHFRTRTAKSKPFTAVNLFSGFYDQSPMSGLNWSSTRRFQSGISAFHASSAKAFSYNYSIQYLDDNGYRLGEDDHRIRGSFAIKYKPEKIAGLQIQLASSFQANNSSSFLLWQSYNQGYTTKDKSVTHTDAINQTIDPSVMYVHGKWKHAVRGRWLYVKNDVHNPDPSVNQNNASQLFYTEYQGQFHVNASQLLNIGCVLQQTLSRAPLYQGQNQAQNRALFAQYDVSYKKWTSTLGMRYEWFEMNNRISNKPVFRAGINYEATRSTFLRAGFGQGFRFPTIAESYIQTSADIVIIMPNPNLKPESSWSAEIGVKQAIQFKKLSMMLDACYYINEYNDMIEFNAGIFAKNASGGDMFGFKSLNTGKTRISGTELTAQFQIPFHGFILRGMGGYTFSLPIALEPNKVYATDLNGNPISYANSVSDTTSSNILKYRYKHLFKADLELIKNKWSLGTSLKYNSYMEVIDKIFLSPIIVPGMQQARYDGRNGTYVTDVRLGYQLTPHCKINSIVNNLFNIVSMTRPADLRAPRFYAIQLQFKW